MNYREALEFIGEVRAGISWERFCMKGVRHADAFIEILNDGEDARKFLSSAGISREYISDQIRQIFSRLHLNRDSDHYLTLALSPNATEDRIHKRWKELMLLYHPDRNRDAEAAPCAARINEAYSVLKSPEKRMEYDRSMRPSLDGYPLGREVGKFRTPPPEHVIGSPRMRSILSKLIIPSCAIVAAVILLVMFHERRQALEQMKEKVEAEVKEQVKVQAKEETKEEVKAEAKVDVKAEVKEQVKVKEEPKEKVKVEVKVKEETKAKDEVKGKEQTKKEVKAKTEVKAEVKEQVKVKEEPKEKVKAEVKVKEETKAKAEVKAGDKVKEEVKVQVKAQEQINEKAKVEEEAKERTKEKVMARVEAESMEGAATQFISRYARAYEEGDIDKFMSFFSSSVVENGKMNYEEIRRAYKKNFENSRYRYSLRNVTFRKNGDDVIVTASYLININRSAENADLVQGDIRWTLCREGGGLKITKVDYERR